MRRQEKVEIVEGLKKELSGVAGVVAVDYRGLKVEEINEVRSQVKERGGNFRVVKNRLVKIAAQEVGLTGIEEFLTGPTALGWHRDDVVELCKVLVEMSKKYEALKLKGGVIEGKKLEPESVKELSRLPGRAELLALLAQDLAGGPRKLLWLMRAFLEKMVRLLVALKEQKEK